MEDCQKIKEWIRFACECNGVPELSQVILVEWNKRFTSRLGDAIYNRVSMRARIRLSTPLWSLATTADIRMETVVHETCHIVVDYKHRYAPRPHGSEWKEAMRNCGLKPLRLHTIDRTGLARRRRLFVLCDCPNQGIEEKCRIGIRTYNNLVKKGKEHWCKICGLHLNQNSSIEEDSSAHARV